MTSPTRLRISIMAVNYAPERSGIAPYIARLAGSLASNGHAVQVLTSRPHYPEWRVAPGYERSSTEQQGAVTVRRLRHYIPGSPRWYRRILFEASFGLRLVFSSWKRADLVVCVSPALIATAMVAVRASLTRHRPALGVIVQDLYSCGVKETAQGGGLSRVAKWFEGAVLRRFDGVVVIHDRFKSQIEVNLGVAPEKISVIRNWNHVTPEFDCDIEAFRKSLGWGEEIVVLHAGAMGVKQDLQNVVAAARVAEEVDAPMKFVLLGDGSQRVDLAAAAAGVGTIELRDQMDDVAFKQALVSADVLLVNERPGLSEMAVPSKLTTYFRAGKPVIAATEADSTTAGELAAAGGGVRVAPGQPLQLVEAVLDLTQRPGDAQRMAVSAQEYCNSVLGEDAALAKYDSWVARLGHRTPATERLVSNQAAAVPAQRRTSRIGNGRSRGLTDARAERVAASLAARSTERAN